MSPYAFDESTTVTPKTLVEQTTAHSGGSDRPIWIALAGSALGVLAAIPAMMMVFGPVPAGKLLWAALAAGLTLGMVGLLVVALVGTGWKMLGAGRGQAATSPESVPHASGNGQLAFE